jgi:hypothetical protein
LLEIGDGMACSSGMRSIASALILGVLIAPCHAEQPLDVVKRFYGELKALEVRHNVEEKTIGKFRPLLTESLNQEFTASQKAMAAWWEEERKLRVSSGKAEAKEEALESENKPPFVDSPIFSGIHESGEVESYGDPCVAGGRAYIPVKVIDKQSQPSVSWVDIVILHQTKEGWRIDDILYFIENGHPRSSLRQGIDSKGLEP